MGSKKRSSADSSEDVEKKNHTDSFMKKKKKSKRDKMNADDSDAEAAAAPHPGVACTGKDMEKRKKRKASDKERKRAALDNDGDLPRPAKPPAAVVSESNSDGPETSSAAAASSSLPELPLSYFRDLASPEGSVREAAATSLVTRLQEIQKQYEMLPDKESVDGGLMLEAEKNDGLDNCAPHLRYALRRLIRGVSSSREVYLLLWFGFNIQRSSLFCN